jgi:hypothetical protein
MYCTVRLLSYWDVALPVIRLDEWLLSYGWAGPSETSVGLYETIWHRITEDCIVDRHCQENQKYHWILFLFLSHCSVCCFVCSSVHLGLLKARDSSCSFLQRLTTETKLIANHPYELASHHQTIALTLLHFKTAVWEANFVHLSVGVTQSTTLSTNFTLTTKRYPVRSLCATVIVTKAWFVCWKGRERVKG